MRYVYGYYPLITQKSYIFHSSLNPIFNEKIWLLFHSIQRALTAFIYIHIFNLFNKTAKAVHLLERTGHSD